MISTTADGGDVAPLGNPISGSGVGVVEGLKTRVAGPCPETPRIKAIRYSLAEPGR